jgi:hypothetical protein
MASDPFSIAQELAEVKAAKELAHEYGCRAEDNKDYMSMLNSIRKKHKGLMKMSKMTAMAGMGSSSAKQTKKEKIIWVDSAKKDADNFKEAVELLPEVFGEGRYGTSGVKSRGGQQNFKNELCAWKRVAKDGKHYRILEHTTGYFYQEGFLPSDTAEQDADEDEEAKEGANEGDDDDDDEEEEEEEAPKPPAKKQKGGKGAAQAPGPAVAPAKAPKARGNKAKESPRRSSSRSRK